MQKDGLLHTWHGSGELMKIVGVSSKMNVAYDHDGWLMLQQMRLWCFKMVWDADQLNCWWCTRTGACGTNCVGWQQMGVMCVRNCCWWNYTVCVLKCNRNFAMQTTCVFLWKCMWDSHCKLCVQHAHSVDDMMDTQNPSWVIKSDCLVTKLVFFITHAAWH